MHLAAKPLVMIYALQLLEIDTLQQIRTNYDLCFGFILSLQLDAYVVCIFSAEFFDFSGGEELVPRA